MRIWSPSFADGAAMPRRHAREGGASPPLRFSGVPRAARSMVLVAEDLDAPIGTFTHWLVWNIPPDVEGAPEGGPPPGARVGLNGYGEVGYIAPAPAAGRHRYRFRLLALDTELPAEAPGRKDRIEAEAEGHVIAEAELTGHYGARRGRNPARGEDHGTAGGAS